VPGGFSVTAVTLTIARGLSGNGNGPSLVLATWLLCSMHRHPNSSTPGSRPAGLSDCLPLKIY
jgi:hypothetical protein